MGRALAIAGVLGILVLSTMVTSTLADVGPKDQLRTDSGTTTEFGGGDYKYVQFGKDARFGVIYGTSDHPNGVVILAAQSRLIGGADVFDANGARVGRSVPIPIYTVFAQKVEDLFEFNDTDQDGLIDYVKRGEGLQYNDYPLHEPVYKGVSLETAWEPSHVDLSLDPHARTVSWDFSLTARNLSYRAIGDSDGIRRQVAEQTLEEVTLSFHLTASIEEVTNASLRWFRITVDGLPGNPHITDSQAQSNRTVSGQRLAYQAKFDQRIEGWDLDATNAHPRLLMEWHAIAGTYIDRKVLAWLHAQFVADNGAEPEAAIDTPDGREVLKEGNAAAPGSRLERTQLVEHRRIQLQDEWQKVGALTWVSNVTVDGQEGQMYTQVQGHHKFSVPWKNGQLTGFKLLGGFSYPSGASIFHDPALSGAMITTSLGGGPSGTPGRYLPLAVGVVAIGAVAVGGVALAIKKGRSNRRYFEESLDMGKPDREQGWDQYHEPPTPPDGPATRPKP